MTSDDRWERELRKRRRWWDSVYFWVSAAPKLVFALLLDLTVLVITVWLGYTVCQWLGLLP